MFSQARSPKRIRSEQQDMGSCTSRKLYQLQASKARKKKKKSEGLKRESVGRMTMEGQLVNQHKILLLSHVPQFSQLRVRLYIFILQHCCEAVLSF